MKNVTPNMHRILAELKNYRSILKDISCGRDEGNFIPQQIEDMKISKADIRNLECLGFLTHSLTSFFQVPCIEYKLTSKARKYLDKGVFYA